MNTHERELLEQALEALEISYSSDYDGAKIHSAKLAIRAALAAPESGAMAEIDYTDDDALRFIQRVLESDAPGADKKAARDMVVRIRTRVLKARASKPATAPDLSAAYIGAREDLAIWKKRALEAEETARQLNRALAEEVNGPTFMGEPVLPATAPAQPAWHDAPTVPGNWILETLAGGLELFEEITQTEIDNETTWPGRWYGPLPEDKT